MNRMKTGKITINGAELKELVYQTVVVGSGASGFNAAYRLHKEGQTDIAVVTEHLLAGTSRNTGSDKQTYYKMTLSGGTPDSVHEMAETLFEGGCMDGEHALCEASLSTLCFYNLVELGMPFPRNKYGEFIGYKTDHDPRERATSIGPYTSKRMTEVLETAVKERNIPILDKLQVIRVLTEDNAVVGLLCLNIGLPEETAFADRLTVIRSKNVIFATGGPAGMYAHSVYPFGHFGASGLAFEVGVKGKNLTEWQFGMASVKPRWNVSGTYMQVMPQFISTDADGSNPKEFLFDFFKEEKDMDTLLEAVFLKGYQWPFDVRKIGQNAKGGQSESISSLIDILVYMEQSGGRRVFLDYRQNPKNQEIDFTSLKSETVKDYLQKAEADFGTPIERLAKMNQPAVDFYKEHGVDLWKEPLEIALCVQHNNGGLSVDGWWQTNLSGFFAVGEVAGSHGVYRPGGSALNSGQVGSTRAAQFIAQNCQGEAKNLGAEVSKQIEEIFQFAKNITESGNTSVDALWKQASLEMSTNCGPIRSKESLEGLHQNLLTLRENLESSLHVSSSKELPQAFRLREMLLSQEVYLTAVLDYVAHNGKSRGSALYTDPKGNKPYENLPDLFTFSLEEQEALVDKQVQEIQRLQGKLTCSWRPVHKMETQQDFFETVWRAYREHKNIIS